jgi:hypothetical protein
VGRVFLDDDAPMRQAPADQDERERDEQQERGTPDGEKKAPNGADNDHRPPRRASHVHAGSMARSAYQRFAPSAQTMTSSSGATVTDSDRLAKLWEAYRVQEEEYKAALAHAERLARELEGRDSQAAARERLFFEKDAEISRLHDEVRDRDERIARLLALEEDVKAVGAYKERISQLEAAYAQEKERLAKLFLLYEEATRTGATRA